MRRWTSPGRGGGTTSLWCGDLWFGSITGGATRYDGKSFRKWTKKEGLASNDVHWILEDRDGAIWLATTGGVSRHDGKSFTNYTVKDGLPHNEEGFSRRGSACREKRVELSRGAVAVARLWGLVSGFSAQRPQPSALGARGEDKFGTL